MYDIIGDIHGRADELEALLLKLGYERHKSAYRHPERKAIFVGDFIDGQGQHRKTFDICRSMVEQETALAVMGNHEFNAICYSISDGAGDFLRPHNEKNIRDHAEFIAEFPFQSSIHQEAISWFKTLPLFLDLGELRIIHAVWHHTSFPIVAPFLDENNCLTPDAYVPASDKSHSLYHAIEYLLKGIELELPPGVSFRDKKGNLRTAARIRWWDEQATHWSNATIGTGQAELPNTPLPEQRYRYTDTVPLFVGHYWMSGQPRPMSDQVACVDYSVARPGGRLVAYRWSGEQKLIQDNFTWIDRNQ